MLNLIKNELIKLLHRPSFYISIALIIAGTFAVAFISNKIDTFEDSFNKNKYEQRLESYKDMKDGKKENTFDSVAWLDSSIEILEIKLAYQISDGDWRSNLVENYVSYKKSSQEDLLIKADELFEIIKTNDWRKYYEGELSLLEASQKEVENKGSFDNSDDYYILKYKLMLEHDIAPYDNLYEDIGSYLHNMSYIMNDKEGIQNYTKKSIERLESNNKVLLFRIENHIENASYNKEANSISNTMYLSSFVIVILLILSTIIFTSEFSNKTIKHLIMCPYGRSKIILSKLVVIILMGVSFFALFYFSNLGFSALLNPDNANTLKYLIIPDGNIHCLSYYSYTLLTVLLDFVIFLFYLSILVFLAIFTKSSAATMGITVVLEMSSLTVIEILYSELGWSFLQYLPFSTCNFKQYLNCEYIAGNFNLVPSVAITAGTMLVVLIIAFVNFRKLEV